MKSLLSICLVAGSALIASSTLTHPFSKVIPPGISFFTCNVNEEVFTAANDSSLTVTFTYTDDKHLVPATLFMIAEIHKENHTSSFYLQPINDDAPAKKLLANNNLYKDFYITYRAADNTFYNTTTAPGNLEITCIDSIHRTVTGKLNCVLYSSSKKDWLLVTNGRFRIKY